MKTKHDRLILGSIVFAVLVLLVCLARLAFAAEPVATSTAPSTPSGVGPLSSLLLWLNEIAAPLIAAGLGWLGTYVAKLIKAKTSNAWVAGTLEHLDYAVINAVKSIQQTIVERVKTARDPNSPGGATITETEATEIKRAAIATAKTFLGVKGLGELAKVFGLGLGDVAGLDRIFGDRIEAAVHDLRLTKTVVERGTMSLPPPPLASFPPTMPPSSR